MWNKITSNRRPWQALYRVVFFQAGIVLFLFLLFGLAARYYFRKLLLAATATEDLSQVLGIYDTTLILLLLGTGLIFFLFAIALTRRLVFPIGRMVIKAKSVLDQNYWVQKAQWEEQFERLDQETFDEWSDLESSIEEIKRDLEAKIESLKLEREEQATLMSAISDAILAVDLEGAPLFYNSRFAVMTGTSGVSQNKRLWEIFRDPEILEAFQSALQESKTTTVKAIPFDTAQEKRYFSISVSPLCKNNVSVYGAVGIFHDVTDLKRAEQMRIDFVANVSHELRTPLTSIKGYVDTLLQDTQQGRPLSSEFLEIIARNTDRLMDLIHDLLDLSSLDSKEAIHKTHLNTQELTSRVLQQMKGSFESKKQEVQMDIQVPSVEADSRRIEQVLINLLDNAHKYTPREGKISIHWEKAPRQGVLLKIKNSGPCIPKEHHSRLFERFYRVDKARSREQGGTGLGLAIVKHILQRHGGSVWVESVPGQGSTFICQFPVQH